MEVIFGTTSDRKKNDLQNIINQLGLELQVLSMDDIGWNRGDIIEDGSTIEENSLIKAKAIHSFCKDNNIDMPIITDDAGLFVESLDNKPGVFTSRYGDDELALNPQLPEYQCVLKLLRELKDIKNRDAVYRCCVTIMLPDGSSYQKFGESNGTIAENIIGDLTKPYFYSVFILQGTKVTFNRLKDEELNNTYRYRALKESLHLLVMKWL